MIQFLVLGRGKELAPVAGIGEIARDQTSLRVGKSGRTRITGRSSEATIKLRCIGGTRRAGHQADDADQDRHCYIDGGEPELSADETAVLRETIAQDAELTRLHEQLKGTINLIREAAATSTTSTPAQPAPLKLSAERREKLLAQFKTVRAPQLVRSRRRDLAWLVPMSAALIERLRSCASGLSSTAGGSISAEARVSSVEGPLRSRFGSAVASDGGMASLAGYVSSSAGP